MCATTTTQLEMLFLRPAEFRDIIVIAYWAFWSIRTQVLGSLHGLQSLFGL